MLIEQLVDSQNSEVSEAEKPIVNKIAEMNLTEKVNYINSYPEKFRELVLDKLMILELTGSEEDNYEIINRLNEKTSKNVEKLTRKEIKEFRLK